MKRAIRSSDPGYLKARISTLPRRAPRGSFRPVPAPSRQDLRPGCQPTSGQPTSPTAGSPLLPSGFTAVYSCRVSTLAVSAPRTPAPVNSYGQNSDRKALRSVILYSAPGSTVKLNGPSTDRKALRSMASRKDLRPRGSDRKNLRPQILPPVNIYNGLSYFPLVISI